MSSYYTTILAGIGVTVLIDLLWSLCLAVLCSLLTLAAILVMGVGRYHGQTKTLVELRKAPPVELLDQDQHLLVCCLSGPHL